MFVGGRVNVGVRDAEPVLVGVPGVPCDGVADGAVSVGVSDGVGVSVSGVTGVAEGVTVGEGTSDGEAVAVVVGSAVVAMAVGDVVADGSGLGVGGCCRASASTTATRSAALTPWSSLASARGHAIGENTAPTAARGSAASTMPSQFASPRGPSCAAREWAASKTASAPTMQRKPRYPNA